MNRRRDNCIDGLYCDGPSLLCAREKALGEKCAADRECVEYNCGTDGICHLPPEAPNSLPSWSFGLIGAALAACECMQASVLESCRH